MNSRIWCHVGRSDPAKEQLIVFSRGSGLWLAAAQPTHSRRSRPQTETLHYTGFVKVDSLSVLYCFLLLYGRYREGGQNNMNVSICLSDVLHAGFLLSELTTQS